jgi:cell division protease FtsH
LGGEFGEQKDYSEETASKIDHEISFFVNEGVKMAEKIVKSKKDLIEKVAKTLIKKETLEREDYEKIIGKENNEKKK